MGVNLRLQRPKLRCFQLHTGKILCFNQQFQFVHHIIVMIDQIVDFIVGSSDRQIHKFAVAHGLHPVNNGADFLGDPSGKTQCRSKNHRSGDKGQQNKQQDLVQVRIGEKAFIRHQGDHAPGGRFEISTADPVSDAVNGDGILVNAVRQ